MSDDGTESSAQMNLEQDSADARSAILKVRDFSNLANEFSDVIMIVTLPDRQIDFVNRAVTDMFGYTQAECIGRSTEFLYPSQGDYLKFAEKFDGRSRTGKTALKREITQRRKNGALFIAEHSSKLLLDNGVPFAVIIIIRDVTGARTAARQLAESETNAKAILENLPLGVIVLGRGQIPFDTANNEILFANRAMLDMYGYTSVEELISTPPIARLSPESIETIRERFLLLHSGQNVPTNFEISIIHKDGQIKHLAVQSSTIAWNGDIKGALYFHDVTERKVMEEQLRHAQVLASLGEMTAGIAHEVGNPLSSIVLYSEIAMKSKDVTRQTKKDLKVIHDEARRAASLMKDLLAYSRKLTPNFQRVDICAVIRRVVELRQYQAKVRNIKVDCDSLAYPAFVRGDHRQLIQVFMNLLMNAEEAVGQMDGGSIKFLCDTDVKNIKIHIKDDGPGIPEANINKIFMPFFSTKKIGEGTGLGLAICYGIITAHKGTISAFNNAGGYGATFTVELPSVEDGRQEPLL